MHQCIECKTSDASIRCLIELTPWNADELTGRIGVTGSVLHCFGIVDSLLHRFIASSICWAFLHWLIVALCHSLFQAHWISGLLISWFDTLIHWSVVLDSVHLCFIDSLILCFTEPGYIVSLVGWSGFIVSLIHWFMIHGLIESLALFHRRIDFESLVASCKFTGSLIPWFM